MLKVDFYVLPENSSREHFACALVQKALTQKQDNHIYIDTASESAAAALDDLLWTFKDTSFLPHCLLADNADDVPVVIGHGAQTHQQIPDHARIMINLSNQMPQSSNPDALNKVERILEIVAGSESDRQQARQRYANYRDQGHELNSHTIESSHG